MDCATSWSANFSVNPWHLINPKISKQASSFGTLAALQDLMGRRRWKKHETNPSEVENYPKECHERDGSWCCWISCQFLLCLDIWLSNCFVTTWRVLSCCHAHDALDGTTETLTEVLQGLLDFFDGIGQVSHLTAVTWLLKQLDTLIINAMESFEKNTLKPSTDLKIYDIYHITSTNHASVSDTQCYTLACWSFADHICHQPKRLIQNGIQNAQNSALDERNWCL